jgi:hypothetical protein
MGTALAKIDVTDVAPINELKGWAALAIQAQIIPSNMNTFQAMAIVQAGKEMGLQPLQSLRSMSFIKGRLTMSVQLQLAMAKNRGVTMDDPDEGEGYCEVVLHRGKETVTCKYTKEDAKKAGLISSGGSWDKYERQMLRWRAIGDALRLIAPDMTMNLLSPEEAASIEPLQPLSVESLKQLAPAPKPEAANPVATPPATVEKPPPATPPADGKEPEKTVQDLRHDLGELAQIAVEAGIYSTTGDAIQDFASDEKFKSKCRDVAGMQKDWAIKKAITKAQAVLNSIPRKSSLDETRDDDVL